MKRMYLLLVILWIAGLVQSALAGDIASAKIIDTGPDAGMRIGLVTWSWFNQSPQPLLVHKIDLIFADPPNGNASGTTWLTRRSDGSVLVFTTGVTDRTLELSYPDFIEFAPGDGIDLHVNGAHDQAVVIIYYQ